jgi:inorganic pyrophosphatase
MNDNAIPQKRAFHPWHDVSPHSEGLPKNFRAIIEIPLGSTNKYEVDEETGLLKLDRVLYSAVHYPANYGFIPQTMGEDGDPLDVLLLGSSPIYPLTIVEARAIGVLTMKDQEQQDHKIIAVHVHDPEYNSFSNVNDLPPHRLAVLKRFFEDYKILEGKEVIVHDILPSDRALPLIEKALQAYRDSESK